MMKLKEIIDKLGGKIQNRIDNKQSYALIERSSLQSESILQNEAFFMTNNERIGCFSEDFKKAISLSMKFHQDRSIVALIEGESGVGKEVISKVIHNGPGKSSEPMVTINCSAISPSLFESELFGYEQGAFTGSKSGGMIGKLELAHGGTLFLDEIGEMPLDLQPKLLRALEERAFYRVGGVKSVEIDIRIIAATNRNLREFVAEGKFRNDLFHRLNTGYIKLAPLREQKNSILPLAQMFLNEFTEKRGKRFKYIHKDAGMILENYDWPGNVRELKNVIERVVLLNDGLALLPEHLSFLSLAEFEDVIDIQNVLNPLEFSLPELAFNIEDYERLVVKKALDRFNGNKTKTANYLGLSRTALRSRIK